MELRRLSLCMAFFLLAVISQCSEARHSLHRRAATGNDDYVDDGVTYEQNDAEGDAEDEEVEDAIIETLPATYKLVVGSAVQLECRTKPARGVVVVWSKEDQQYFLGLSKMSGPDRVSIAPNTTDIIIRDLQPSDSGRYNCTIAQMPPVTIIHTVVVEESARIIQFTASDNGILAEGSDLLLTCNTTGIPKPEIIWSRTRNGGNEKLTEKDGEFSTHTFFAKKVTREMSGKYFCYAMNSAGHSEANVTVTVYGKPRIHAHKTIVNTDINHEAELHCFVHDEINPHIRWYKDGRLIEDSSEMYTVSVNGSRSTLTVMPRNDADFGTFTCEAENRHGKHNRSIDLVQSPVIEDLDVNGPKLSWTVRSHQPLEDIELQLRRTDGEGEWETIKVPLPETNDEKRNVYEVIYVIDKVLDAGKYEATVKVKNTKSWSSHSEPTVVTIENQAQAIQTASVMLPGAGAAHAIRPHFTAAVSTVLMCLLVRTL